MNVFEKLAAIQAELKAPKGQYNSFGKYKYRSCEDILEAVKPLLVKYKATLVITDDIRQVGGRVYVQAQANLVDLEAEEGCRETVSNTAWAREPEEKKGMDEAQITGTASSYARKYCLNGLFLIDDTKDADTDEYRNQQMKEEGNKVLSNAQVVAMRKRFENNNIDEAGVLKMYKLEKLEDMTVDQMVDINNKIEAHKKAAK